MGLKISSATYQLRHLEEVAYLFSASVSQSAKWVQCQRLPPSVVVEIKLRAIACFEQAGHITATPKWQRHDHMFLYHLTWAPREALGKRGQMV